MRSFRKALLSSVLVLAVVTVMAGILFTVVESGGYSLSEDLRERLVYEGKIDFVNIGASHAKVAFVPEILDQQLGCFSFNLAQDSIINSEKLMLLKNEIARNPIKTVVIEMSYDTVTKETRQEYTDAAFFFNNRLDNYMQRVEDVLLYTAYFNWELVLSNCVISSITSLVENRRLEVPDPSIYNGSLKGVWLLPSTDQTLPPDYLKEIHNVEDVFSEDWLKSKHLAAVEETIRLCKDHGCRVIVVVTPVSDNYLWIADKMDDFRVWATNYCQEHEIEYYDYNLSRRRYSLFHDDISFSTDNHHLSEQGARAMTELLCETILKVDAGEDVSADFYESYEELEADSPYMAMMNGE